MQHVSNLKGHWTKTLIIGFILALVAFTLNTIPTAQAEPSLSRYIVVANDHGPGSHVPNLVHEEGGQILKGLGIINGYVALLPQAAIDRLESNLYITSIEKDIVVYALGKPDKCSPWPSCKGGDDPEPPPPGSQTTPTGISTTGADAVWESTTGSGVKVAVLDTGIDNSHADLSVVGGTDFTGVKGKKSRAWRDDNGHGTHVAGTIAALDNTQDVVGMAPDASLYAVKVLDRNGSGWVSDIISGLDWSVAQGMDIANMSLGAATHVQALEDACDNAAAAGVLLVAASGNSGDGNGTTNNVEYPAKYGSVIAVGAVDHSDVAAYFTSDGAEVEVSAPGVGVESTQRGGGTSFKNGTSMATPHVAGAAALLMEADPGASLSCVRSSLSSSAVDLGAPGHDVFYGHGRIDVPAALTALASCL